MVGSPPPAPKGKYVPARRHGTQLWISGHTDRTRDDPPTRGLVGADVSVEEATAAARRAAANLLAAADEAVGLDAVAGVVFLRGYVVAAPGFVDHSAVVDGASTVLADVLRGEADHARSALGVATLPGGACVELEAVFELHP